MSPQVLSLSLDRGACGQCLSPPGAPCGLPSIQLAKSSPNKDRTTKGFLEKKTTTKNLTVCFYFSEHNTISIYRMLGIKQLFKQTIWGERQMFARCTIIWPVMKSLQVKRISAEPGTDSCCFRGVMRTCRRCRCRPSSARKTRVLLFAVGRERVR